MPRDLIGTPLLAPIGYGSFLLQGANYRTLFLRDAIAGATPEAQTILAQVPQQFPVDVVR